MKPVLVVATILLPAACSVALIHTPDPPDPYHYPQCTSAAAPLVVDIVMTGLLALSATNSRSAPFALLGSAGFAASAGYGIVTHNRCEQTLRKAEADWRSPPLVVQPAFSPRVTPPPPTADAGVDDAQPAD